MEPPVVTTPTTVAQAPPTVPLATELPKTGSDVGPTMVNLAAPLLAVGGALVLMARRRSTTI